MLFSDIAMIDENFEHHPHSWVGVRDGYIVYVADNPPTPQEIKAFGEIYDGREKLLLPGFYNAHSHAPMTLLRGYAESLPLHVWLNDKVFPFEDKITEQDAYWGMLLACAEMIRYGVVSCSDMYYHARARIRAVLESGMKMNLCEGLIAFKDKPYREYPDCQTNEDLVREFHNSADHRIKINYNIHAEYTSNPTTVADIARIVQEKDLCIHLHASETKKEHEECKRRRGGLTPIQYFDSLGVFENPAIAAHCVWVEKSDIEILAEKGVFVVCNPASNMKLGSGFAPISEMLERGVRVALGTDGMASNNNHDMMQDMYLMSLVYKGASLDPAVVNPQQALRAATRMGALSQGREQCGLIKQGFRADMCVLDTSSPSWMPPTNPLCNVVFSGHGSDVVLTMVDGSIVYRDGNWPTIDVELAKAKTSAATARIIASL